jgi:type VI secretion system ImpM family protein
VSDALGAMGKLADFDEYVAINAASPLFVAFDRWVADGMDAAPQGSADWAARYHAGAVQAFVYSPLQGGPFLAGAFAPSADRAGRKYPLFVAEERAAESIATLDTLPLSLEEVWADASRVVTRARTAGTVSGLKELLAEEGSGPPSEFPEALEGWKTWTESMHLDELGELLFGVPEVHALAGAIRGVLEATAPHRGVMPRRTRLSLRLPLGRAGGAVVCFWLAVVGRALDWKDVVPSFFWTHDGASGSLLLHLGVPPRSAVTQLWMPAPADDLLDLLDPATDAYRGEHRAPRVEAVLSAEDATVSALLDAF